MDGLCFQFDPGMREFIVRPQVGGFEQSPIARFKPPASYEWYNTKRHVEISARGNQYVVSIDGQQVMSFKNDTHSSGKVGLRGWDNSKAEFQDVTVTRG